METSGKFSRIRDKMLLNGAAYALRATARHGPRWTWDGGYGVWMTHAVGSDFFCERRRLDVRTLVGGKQVGLDADESMGDENMAFLCPMRSASPVRPVRALA